MSFPPRPISERFWDKVEKTDTCWVWTAGKLWSGYGVISDAMGPVRKSIKAHRASWELHYGRIPEGMQVCHSCDNPPCVRPDHLFLGTAKDNVQDCISKSRRRLPIGIKHKMHKLTPKAVKEIRERYSLGNVSQRSLADEFGVSQTVVGDAIRRVTWRHVA